MELLVTIGIIALLAGILLPALNAAFRKAEEAQAKTEVQSIETAVKAYLNEYGRFPHGSGGTDVTYFPTNGGLMNVLRSVNSGGNQDYENNPRRIVFLEVSENSLKNPGGTVTANFYDPWGSNYYITVDCNFDNNCGPISVPGYGAVTSRQVIVLSTGRNADSAQTADDLCSWK